MRPDLDEIARDAQRRFAGLPPNGGTRWTTEDRLAAVSFLFEVEGSEAFRQALERGMTAPQVRAYFLTAIEHWLLMEVRKRRRLVPLEEAAEAVVPAGGLDPEDADTLASRVLGRLTEEEKDELAERVLPVPRGPSSSRTHDYRWLRVRNVIREVAQHEELAPVERKSLVEALRARLKAQSRER